MKTKEQMNELKHRYIEAKSDAEIDAIMGEIGTIIANDPEEAAKALLEQVKETNREISTTILRERLKPILPIISLSYIAKTYFNRSRSWLTQRINGNVVNGEQAKFSEDELQMLNYALKDISEKINICAS